MKLFILALAAIVGVLIWWAYERRATVLYVTAAESLGTFLFSPANSTMTVGCVPSPEAREVWEFKHGIAAAMFEFREDRTLCVLYQVSGWPFSYRKRVDLVFTPAEDPNAIHVKLSADGRMPVFDDDVPLSKATKDNPFYLGQP